MTDHRPVDRRRVSRTTLRWAKDSHLVYERVGKWWYAHCVWQDVFRQGLRIRFEEPLEWRGRFTWRDLDIETLWRIIEPMIPNGKDAQGNIHYSIGRSIAASERWQLLGIEPSTSKYHDHSYLVQMEDVLNELAMHGRIFFQYAGSIWWIERTVAFRSVD